MQASLLSSRLAGDKDRSTAQLVHLRYETSCCAVHTRMQTPTALGPTAGTTAGKSGAQLQSRRVKEAACNCNPKSSVAAHMLVLAGWCTDINCGMPPLAVLSAGASSASCATFWAPAAAP